MSTSQTPTKTAEGDCVRPVEARDVKMAKIIIGAGQMEELARANKQVILHPISVLLIIGCGLLLNRVLGFERSPIAMALTSLAPLIGPALVTLPSLGLVEYFQRWRFLARMRTTVGAVDLVNVMGYYTQPSRMWVFQRKGEVSGVVALDIRNPGERVGSVLGGGYGEVAAPDSVDFLAPVGAIAPRASDVSAGTTTATQARDNASTTTMRKAAASAASAASASPTPVLAEIRHLSVDAQVRKYGIGTELLVTALDAAFGIHSVERVVVLTSPYTPGGERLWTKCGFAPVQPAQGWRASEPLGLLGKKGRWLAVGRGEWAAKKTQLFGSK